MYTSVDFTSQITKRRGSLVPQTRGLIHKCGAWIGRDLKNILFYSLSGPNG
jgi:hypothetical protein